MRHLTSKTYLLLFLCYIVGQLTLWKLDTRIPFEMTGPVVYDVPKPGETVKITIPVKRDIERDCSVLWSRYMFDSEGTRFDLTSTKFMSAEGIAYMDKLTPNILKVSIDIPPKAAPGNAIIVTQLAYMCNPFQYIWPVDHDMRYTIKVAVP